METITKNNYQIYILDFYEDALLENEKELLFSFLKENPEYKTEFSDFENITLNANKIDFKGKIILKDIPDNLIYDISQKEFRNITSLENAISNSEKISESDFDMFGKTLLVPDKKIIFSKKQKTKKYYLNETGMKIVFSVISVAALFLLIFSLKNIMTQECGTYKNISQIKFKIITKKFQKNTQNYTEDKDIKNSNKNFKTVKIENNTISNPEYSKKEQSADKFWQEIQTYETISYIEILPLTENILIDNIKDFKENTTHIHPQIIKSDSELNPAKIAGNKKMIWTIAETGISMVGKVTDIEILMQNSYSSNGALSELNITAKNLSYNKKFN